MALNIGKIVTVSMPAVVAELKKFSGGPFLSTGLNQAFLTGVIKLVEFDQPNDQFEMLHVPAVWGFADEVKNPTENGKISFAKDLIQKAIQQTDDILLQKLGWNDLLISKSYFYYPGQVVTVHGQPAQYVMLSTAFHCISKA